MGGRRTYRNTEEALLSDFSAVVFINLDDFLDSSANRNEEPPRLSQLID